MRFDELFDTSRHLVHVRLYHRAFRERKLSTHGALTESVKFSTGILIVNLLVRGREKERPKSLPSKPHCKFLRVCNVSAESGLEVVKRDMTSGHLRMLTQLPFEHSFSITINYCLINCSINVFLTITFKLKLSYPKFKFSILNILHIVNNLEQLKYHLRKP